MKSSSEHARTKVVLDTNIVVSALIAKQGQPAKLFEKMILGKIENYTTKEITQEIEKVLKRKEIVARANKIFIEFILKQYKKHSIIVSPTKKLNVVKEDPEDNKFIECAIEANADYIVSGDPHLTSIKKFGRTIIIKPKEAEKL